MKIKKIILAVMLMLLPLTAFACKQSPTISWTDSQITISVGEEKQLNKLVVLENGQFSDIVFSSLNESIVKVEQGKIIALSAGNALVEAKIDDVYSYLTVNVLKVQEKFAVAMNVSYSSETNTLSWDRAYKVENGETKYASSYILNITRNGQKITQEVETNSYKFEQAGDYRVTVVSKSNGYKNSDESQAVSFKVLVSPNNLMFDKQTQTLSWQGGDYEFIVSVNNVLMPRTTQKSVQLDLSEEGSYDLKVKAVKDGFVSWDSNVLTITKLTIPQINVQNGVITYTKTQESLVSKYVISIKTMLGNETLIDSTSGTYTLENIDAGQYNIKIKAVGTDTSIDSEFSQSITIKKLNAPVINFDSDSMVVSTDLDNVKLYIKNTVTQQIKQVDFVSKQHNFDENVGIYELYAETKATNPDEIISNLSSKLYIKKLSNITNLTHKTENNKSILCFDNAEGCEGYNVYVDGSLVNGTLSTTDGCQIELSGNTDDIFNSGTKQIYVVGYDNTFKTNGSNYFVIADGAVSDTITVTRFANLNPTYTKPLATWEEVENAVYYQVELYKNGELEFSREFDTNSFSSNALGFGNYELKVKAIGDNQSYLSSFEFGKVEFSVKEKLDTPQVTFNHQTNCLVVAPVENANSYVIKYNNEVIETLTQNLTYNVSAIISDASTYQFVVFAQNTLDNADNNGNLYNSNETVVNIEKLASIENINVSKNEKISIDTTAVNSKLDSSKYEVLINDEVVENLTSYVFEGKNFDVKVKLISNKTSKNPYYIDSEIAEFTLNRLDEVTNIDFTDYLISWSEIEGAKNYLLNVKNTESEYQFESDENSFDLKSNDLYYNYANLTTIGWDLVIIAQIDNQTINAGQTGYLNSQPSEKLVINKLATPVINQIVSQDENDTSVKIDWQDVENAIAYFVDEQNLTLSEFIADSLGNSTYTYNIVTYSPKYLLSDPLTVVLSRINKVTSISVSQNEDIRFSYDSAKVSEIKINNVASEIPYDISSVTSDKQIFTIQLIGKQDGNNFYLTSELSSFAFKRLEKPNAPSLENTTISFDIVSDCNYYSLLFSDGQDELEVKVNAKNGTTFINSININDYPALKQFLINEGEYTVKISACMNGYSHQEGENNVGLLTSEYSEPLNFEKLENAYNVKVEAENTIAQKNVTISWDAVLNAETYSVYINDKLFEKTEQTQISTDKLTFQSDYAKNGLYNIYVIANASGMLSSEKSDVVTVKRLNKITSSTLQVSPQAIFSWGSMVDTTNFATFIEYDEYSSTEVTVEGQSYSYDQYLHSQDYAGYINFYVCPIGNRTTVLSGEYQLISVLKLDMPVAELTGEYIKIAPSVLASDAQFDLVVKYINSNSIETILDEFTLKANTAYYYPESWNNNAALSDENGKFVFEIVTKKQNCINSNVKTEEITRVKQSNILGFTRLEENNDKIQFAVNVNQVISGAVYCLEIVSGGNTYLIDNVNIDNENNVIYPLQGILETKINNGNFELNFFIKASGYINSYKQSVQGYKLNKISNFSVSNGELTWNRAADSRCTGYLLKVTNSVDTYYHSIESTVTSDTLQGYQDLLVTNIKCVGNIPYNSYINENIVLDSNYISTLSQDDTSLNNQDLTVTKLAIPSEINVVDGEFKIKADEGVQNYYVKANDKLYNVDGAFDEVGYFVGTPNGIYEGNNKLAENTLYNFVFQARSNKDNTVYSDFSSEVAVKILPNPVLSSNYIKFDWSEDDVNKYVISWEQSSLFNNYIVRLSNVYNMIINTQLIKTNTNSTYLNCDEMPFGQYDVQIKVLGSSEKTSEDFYYLSSAYSQSNHFIKLGEAYLSIENGILKWSAVDGADGYYVYYMLADDPDMTEYDFVNSSSMYNQKITTNYWNIPDNFSSLTANNKYYFGVRAVSSNVSEFAPSQINCYGNTIIEAGEEDTFVFTPVAKLKAPDMLVLDNGKLVWNTGNYNYSFTSLTEATINGGISPFVYEDTVQGLSVVFRFTDNNGQEFKYTVDPIKLFEAEITKDAMFSYIAEMFGLYEGYQFGWPVLSWLTDELIDCSAGEYSFSVMQNGNNTNWLNSMYNQARNIYIPHATTISIDNFVLSWNEVDLNPTKPLNNTSKYSVVVQDLKGDRNVVYKTNDLSIDLRDLVNNDIIPSGDFKVYVYVNGDSDYYLNGLISNVLEIKVLPGVTASMEKGVLHWDSISQTYIYKVSSLTGDTETDYIFETFDNSWDMAELKCFDDNQNRLTYNIQIQCIGNGTTTISGKVANIAKVIKLITPTLEFVKGRFEWTNIEGNEGYYIITNTDTQKLQVELGKDVNYYESNTQGFNNYNIRAIGTTIGNIDMAETCYAVSDAMRSGLDGVMLGSVGSCAVYNGNLVWLLTKDYGDENVTGYRITFDDMHYYESVYLENYKDIYINGTRYISFEFDEKYVAGDYKVYIQAYSSKTYAYDLDGKVYYQLFGEVTQDSTVEFTKLKTVSNIVTNNGVISWTSNDKLSNNYELVFTGSGYTYTFNCQGTTWNPSVLNKDDLEKYARLIAGNTYNLKIRVLGDSISLINSDYSEEVVFTKLATASDVKYIQGNNEGFIIKVIFTDSVPGITSYHYIFKYDNGTGENIISSENSEHFTCGYDSVEEYYYCQVDGSILLGKDTKVLKYQVAIVPVSQTNILISDYTQERSVQPPASLDGNFTYNEVTRSISWTYTSSLSDVSFRIVDELVSVDEEYNVEVISTRVYISQSTTFVLEDVGYHRISICVVLTGESVASSYVYFNYEVGTTGLIISDLFKVSNGLSESSYALIYFDLFESGNGSQESPYVIANEQQFANINYRLQKPSYLGGEKVWNFVLNGNLILNDVTIGAFGGVLDGQYYTLKYSLSNTDNSYISLFESLTSKGIIQNLNVNAKLHQNNSSKVSELYLSGLVYENNGKIYNSTVEKFTYTSALNTSISIHFGGFATFNFGTIERCINNASIVFTGEEGLNQAGVRNSNIDIGAIAYSNGKSGASVKIYQSGNNASITVYAKSVSVGGIASQQVYNSGSSAVIEQCYSKGSIYVLITQSGNLPNYIGGIVGTNQEKVKNSYSLASIQVDLNNLSNALYLGGIAGYVSTSNGANIDKCYVGTTNLSVVNWKDNSPQIGMIVGYSKNSGSGNSYYLENSEISSYNGAEGVKFNNIVGYSDNKTLLNNLSNENYGVYKENGNSSPKLSWES